MFLTDLFNFQYKCKHDKIMPNIDMGYCPDCGKLIKNEWYIARCSCCGVKLKAMVKNGELVAQDNFCMNCGSSEYYIEKISKINFIDINYAVLVKTEVEEELKPSNATQCWQERTVVKPKLLGQYL